MSNFFDIYIVTSKLEENKTKLILVSYIKFMAKIIIIFNKIQVYIGYIFCKT